MLKLTEYLADQPLVKTLVAFEQLPNSTSFGIASSATVKLTYLCQTTSIYCYPHCWFASTWQRIAAIDQRYLPFVVIKPQVAFKHNASMVQHLTNFDQSAYFLLNQHCFDYSGIVYFFSSPCCLLISDCFYFNSTSAYYCLYYCSHSNLADFADLVPFKLPIYSFVYHFSASCCFELRFGGQLTLEQLLICLAIILQCCRSNAFYSSMALLSEVQLEHQIYSNLPHSLMNKAHQFAA